MASSSYESSFNQTVILMFRNTIPPTFADSVIFDAKSLANGLSTLYYGSDNEIKRFTSINYGLLTRRPPYSANLHSVVLLHYKMDIIGIDIAKSFEENIKNHLENDNLKFLPFPHKTHYKWVDWEFASINTVCKRYLKLPTMTNLISRQSFQHRKAASLRSFTNFSAHWLMPFHPKRTKMSEFHTDSGIKQLSMMETNNASILATTSIGQTDIYKIPYRENFHMLVIMRREQPASFSQLHDDICWFVTENRFERLLLSLKSFTRVESIKMPKFKLTSEINVTDGLKTVIPFNSLNLKDAFKDSKMDHVHSPSFGFKILGEFENFENGSNANFIKYISRKQVPLNRPPITVNIDKPFVFFILQDNYIVNIGIFTGKDVIGL